MIITTTRIGQQIDITEQINALLLMDDLAAFMRQAGKRSDVFCPSSIFSCAGKGWP